MTSIKHLVLGITGGIAAYKAAELVRLLVKQGIQVQVVMTEAACQFITPVTLQALSGKPVYTSMWDAGIPNGMPHIALSRQADAILVAPASADFMAKLAQGSADDLLTTLCLASDCPLLVAPAMNKQMWENPATRRNVLQLRKDGILVVGPNEGEQACGETGLGRMLEPEELLQELEASQYRKILAGKRILITAGPTVENIDPVRAISNFSSGKMGYSIAQAAYSLGAEVILVSGPTALAEPRGVHTIHVRSGNDMLNMVIQNIAKQDIFIAVAAVTDFRTENPSPHKIKKNADILKLEFTHSEDILATVASLPDAPFCVGFAAESENLLEYAEQKRLSKKLPLIAANYALDAMGKDESSLVLLDDTGRHELPHAPKLVLAHKLLQHIASMLQSDK